MARAIKRVNYRNPFIRMRRNLHQGRNSLNKILERYVASVALIAKRSMKKAPKGTKNKKRFGTYKRYSKNSKRFKNAASPLETYYFSKGLYSPPGTPPFWHPTGPNPSRRGKASLKNIKYSKMGTLQYRVGPEYFPQRAKPPVPSLHEHGGIAKMRTKSYYDRSGKKIRRPAAFIARYPPRPYMKPAMILGKTHARKGAKSFLDQLNNIGGMKATKRAK